MDNMIPLEKTQISVFSHPGYHTQGKNEADIYGISVMRQVLLQTGSHLSEVTSGGSLGL